MKLHARYRDEPHLQHKGRWVPASEYNETRKIAKTGSTVFDQTTGRPLKNYEWSHKGLSNILTATSRQLGARQRPAAEHLDSFDRFTDGYFKWLGGLLKNNPIEANTTFFDYVAK